MEPLSIMTYVRFFSEQPLPVEKDQIYHLADVAIPVVEPFNNTHVKILKKTVYRRWMVAASKHMYFHYMDIELIFDNADDFVIWKLTHDLPIDGYLN